MEAVKRMMEDKPVVIFSKSDCCMTHSIHTLISSFGANPIVYELDNLPDGQHLEGALLAAQAAGTGTTTFPAVYIGQKLVGSANEVMSLHVKGKLVPLLKKAKAIWI